MHPEGAYRARLGMTNPPPEELPLSSAPELCIEIVSVHNALPKLREKAMA
jgi:hypothetical protein